MKVDKEYLYDLAERVLWTAVEAVLAFLLVIVVDWDYEWVPVLTVALSVLKGVVARRVGEDGSAAMPPGRKTQ